jgi:hypothetical protein
MFRSTQYCGKIVDQVKVLTNLKNDVHPEMNDFIMQYWNIVHAVEDVVLYGCETWSLTLREENRLRVFENRVLKRRFRPKRDK